MEVGKAPDTTGDQREAASACSKEGSVEGSRKVAGEGSSQANGSDQVHCGTHFQEGAQELNAVHAEATPAIQVRGGTSALPPNSECFLTNWVAQDPVSLELLTHVRRVAPARSTLLISGEGGVGKDLLASIIHYLGPEPDAPLLKVDCSAIPPAMLESELFGNERPGTRSRGSKGRIEVAGHGTLVLDEIGALSLPIQLRLLRAIEEGRFQPNGSGRFIANNVRIIALSTTDLRRAAAMHTFREDFYWRLALEHVAVPPLRQRRADIAPLCTHFLARACRLHRHGQMRFSPQALTPLQRHSWPGNVSELRALVEHLALCCNEAEIGPEQLPEHIAEPNAPRLRPKTSLQELERNYIAEVLDFTRGRKSAAAGILGISRKTLLEKRKRYGLD